jgi:hypothetical protein
MWRMHYAEPFGSTGAVPVASDWGSTYEFGSLLPLRHVLCINIIMSFGSGIQSFLFLILPLRVSRAVHSFV